MAMTIEFQKIKFVEEGLYTSIKDARLQMAEAARNIANTLSTRLLACCRTSTTKTAKVRKLMSGIIAHKFIS